MKSLLPALALSLAASALMAGPNDSSGNPPPLRDPAIPPNPNWRIHVEMHVVTLPEKDATALLPALRDDAKIDGAWAKIEALLAAGKAQLLATPGYTFMDGQAADSQEGEELKYPTEWDTPRLVEPQNAPLPKLDDATAKPQDPAAKSEAISITPTQFETRQLGISLLTEGVVSEDGKQLTLRLNALHTRFLSWDEQEAVRMPNGERVTLKQPRFATMKDFSHVSLESGERVLLGAHRVPGDKGEMELFIVHAWTTPRPAPK
jgi:hypothetical protein